MTEAKREAADAQVAVAQATAAAAEASKEAAVEAARLAATLEEERRAREAGVEERKAATAELHMVRLELASPRVEEGLPGGGRTAPHLPLWTV